MFCRETIIQTDELLLEMSIIPRGPIDRLRRRVFAVKDFTPTVFLPG